MAVYQQKARERIRKGLRKAARIAQHAYDEDVNEADTRLVVTMVLDELLGWDTFQHITSETLIKGQYADFALRHNDSLWAIIEVKSIRSPLSAKHLYQAVSYAANEGVDWVILTNGADWQLYRIIFGKPVNQDLVLEVSFRDAEMKPAKKTELLYLLSHEAQRASELEAYYTKKAALCGANVAKVLLGEKMLATLRREMKAAYGHAASAQELATILVDEVICPDAQDKETARLLRRASAHSSRRQTGRAKEGRSPSSGDAPEGEA